MIISELCQNLDSLDEPDAKASMIWIVGEYAERLGVCPLSGIVRDEVPAASLVCSFPVRIDNSGDLLETFPGNLPRGPLASARRVFARLVPVRHRSPPRYSSKSSLRR